MRSLSLTILSVLLFLFNSNLFACGDSNLTSLVRHRLMRWSKADLTVSLKGPNKCSPWHRLKVKTEKELVDLVEKGSVYGTFVVNKELEDKENDIFGELVSYTLLESVSSTKVVIAKVDTVEGYRGNIITAVNTETNEVLIFSTGYHDDYSYYDHGIYKNDPVFEVGDLLRFSNITEERINYYTEDKINVASGFFLIKKGEKAPEGVVSKDASDHVLIKVEEAVIAKDREMARRQAIQDAKEKERLRVANICEILGNADEPVEIAKNSFAITSSAEYLGSPSEKRTRYASASNFFAEESRTTLMYCHGENTLDPIAASFYKDLVQEILNAYKLSDSVKPEVSNAKKAFLNLKLPQGSAFGDESNPSLEARLAYFEAFSSSGSVLLPIGNKEDFQAIIELYELMQE